MLKTKNHSKRNARAEIRKLEKQADCLFQIRMKEKYPYSVLSGQPTEVIHHFVPKSQSNNLRYDEKNACPCTNGEHFRHHNVGDPSLSIAFIKDRGQKWIDDLNFRRHQICKHTKQYLEEIINDLMDTKSLPF